MSVILHDLNLKLEQYGITVRLFSEDTGSGIPSEEIEVINGERETGLSHASGVGLWLMRWIIEKSDGEIDLKNTDQGGTGDTYVRPSTIPPGANEVRCGPRIRLKLLVVY